MHLYAVMLMYAINIWLASIQHIEYDNLRQSRDLSTWNILSTCSLCTPDSLSWDWLNGSWQDETDVFNQGYSQNDYIYWEGGTSNGRIDLREQNNVRYTIAFESNAPVNTVWQWSFRVDTQSEISIKVNRDQDNYENIAMRIYPDSSNNITLSNKDWTKCDNQELFYRNDDLYRVTIRAMLLNTQSTFSATVTQEDPNNFALINLILLVLLVTLIACMTCFWFCILGTHCRMKLIQRHDRMMYMRRVQVLHDNKDIRIRDTMRNMRQGEYQFIKTKYEQNSCVICLEDFVPEDVIHITNECNHAFHTKCLKEWYDSIRVTNDLTCPHCSTVNTKDSKPQDDENVRFSILFIKFYQLLLEQIF